VSYAWEFTDRAVRNFRALEPWLQEETLDEIDSAAADPVVERDPRRDDEQVYDFIREHEGKLVYVFYVASANPLTRIFKVASMGTYSRKI
jgi:hypothetical protein